MEGSYHRSLKRKPNTCIYNYHFAKHISLKTFSCALLPQCFCLGFEDLNLKMSDSGEVMSKLVEDPSDSESSSNEVLSTFLNKNIKKKGKIGIQGTSTMFGKKRSDREFAPTSGTMVKIEIKNGKTQMVSDNRWIGAIITKVFDGVRYIGQVTSYEVETGCFKVVYEDNSYEEVAEEEIPQILAPPDLIRSYYNRAAMGPRKSSYRRKKKPAQENKVPTPPRLTNSAKKAKTPKKVSTYVPLAIREKKKDSYYWY
ncbi:uncharacterized protein LOC115971488 [Quercus lobata]|uniref:uncharacterized protein LOC115971488 n=1 Tax=Quercus lobata TaxID=97700 RepID=UPI001245FCC1|nr:uncharacterized protein LOC115971488 [Quercus lobata]